MSFIKFLYQTTALRAFITVLSNRLLSSNTSCMHIFELLLIRSALLASETCSTLFLVNVHAFFSRVYGLLESAGSWSLCCGRSRSLPVICLLCHSVSVHPTLLVSAFPHFPCGNYKLVFYVCGSVSVLWISSLVYRYIYRTHESSCIGLSLPPSLSVAISGAVRVAAHGMISLFVMAE